MNRRVVRWLFSGMLLLCLSAASFGQVFVSVRIGPPPLPVYAQPICPGPGYYWTPGYWAWDDDGGYYWVPGTWVVAPIGMLWTPGYWGWGGGFYMWHPGYWGPHVGFYGGINYGYGYTGMGFGGGEWRGRNFYYNRSVTNVSVTNVTNVYNKTVIVNNTTVNNVSYNGGAGGVQRRPLPQEAAAERERHLAPPSAQIEHERLAGQNRQNFASENHGRPVIAATARPADFSGLSVIPARAAGGAYHPPAMSPREARGPSAPGNRPFTPANSNNAGQPMGRSTAAPMDQARPNGGFRPFTPPSRGGATPGGNRPGNTNENRANENRPARDFALPPNSNRGNVSASPMYQDHGNSGSNPMYEPKARAARAPQPNPPQSRASQPAPPRRESAPPPQRHESAPPQRRENAPRDRERRPGGGR